MKSPTELAPPPSPHLAWLGRSKPHDKVLPPGVARAILSRPVLVEEHPDGAVIGFASDLDSLTPYRHQKLLDPATHPQFHSLWGWLAEREEPIVRRIGERLMLFGVWCSATHAVQHDALPDWFILTDIVERESGKTWTAHRRNALARDLSLAVPPELANIKTDVAGLTERLRTTPSTLGSGPLAGLIVRLEQGDHLVERALLVRQEVADAPEEPSARKSLERNRLVEPND